MTKTLISQKEQRTVIGKFRKVAEATGITFEHERVRKTKAHPIEENHYRLRHGDTVIAEVSTGIIGLAKWVPDLAHVVRRSARS